MGGSLAELPAPWRDEPYLLMAHGRATVRGVWCDDGAVAVLTEGGGRRPGLTGLGEPASVARLLAAAVEAGADRVARWVTAARGTWAALDDATAAAFAAWSPPSSWDCMWTGAPLTGVPGHAVERLPAADAGVADEVREALDRAHPTASTSPDDERLMGWWVVRDDGRIVALVGALRYAPGLAPHLVSLGVDPACRGRGLAGAVLAAAVGDGLAAGTDVGPAMVWLGLYASNAAARRVYLRHGFTLGHELDSRDAPA